MLLRMTLGAAFTVLGIAGLFLPILQGWLFLLLAFVMFFPRHRWSAKSVAAIDRRFPRIAALLRRIE